MLGVEIEFGNNQIRLETSSYKPKKAKTPARWQGFFQFQMVARGGIDQGLRMFNPSTILEYRGSDVRPARYPHGFGFLCIEAKTEIYSSAKCRYRYGQFPEPVVMIQLLGKSVQISSICLIRSERHPQPERPVVLGSD
jgi:hypothetical protein